MSLEKYLGYDIIPLNGEELYLYDKRIYTADLYYSRLELCLYLLAVIIVDC